MPKKVYRISQVKMVIGFERIDIDAQGGEEVKTNQLITYSKLLSEDQLLALMKEKIEPGEEITCEISPDVLA